MTYSTIFKHSNNGPSLCFQCVVDENGDPTDELSAEALSICQQKNVSATKVSEIIANKEPAIYKAIQEGMERVNAKATSNAQKIQKWVILERDFSVGGGELGELLKVEQRSALLFRKYSVDQV